MSAIRRLNISAKLLIWACALIVIFFATSAYLFRQVRYDAEVANRIVAVNHAVDSAIQRMLERLYSVQENIRRYKLTGSPESVDVIVSDLTRFNEILRATIKAHPSLAEEWQDLDADYEIPLRPGQTAADSLAPDETIRDWTDILEQSLLDNQVDMELALTRLHEAGRRAGDIGLYGLVLCLALGFGGSLALAYQLNRSLTEIRRGIRDLGTGSPPRDVRVLSHDELGELATAFNDMAARLRREEAMRTDFIAMLSHEIRTPLTSIREAVDLIGSGAFGATNEKQSQFLALAEKEAVRLTDLLSRLLSVSRMESEELVLTPESVHLNDLAAKALERATPAAEAKGIRLLADLPKDTPTCACDPGHIQQVLMNLLGNAIKFSAEETAVTVRVRQKDNRAEICVRDTGPGIPKDEHDRVFLKYYREPGVRESVDGAGLGLAIAKRIVEAHGGTLWLDSKPGRGSTFCFSLPLDLEKDAA